MDNKMLIITGIIVILIVIAGAYLLFSSSSTAHPKTSGTPQPSTTVVNTTPVTSVNASNTNNSTTVSGSTSSQQLTVNIATNTSIGEYLTNATGWTLYLYTKDTPNSNASSCYNSCAQYWPPFYVANLTVPSSLNISNFATIKRTDGTMQLTYKGWPLYSYIGDTAAGQLKGEGIGGTWYAVTVPNISYS